MSRRSPGTWVAPTAYPISASEIRAGRSCRRAGSRSCGLGSSSPDRGDDRSLRTRLAGWIGGAPAPVKDPVIAVLPFKNLSSEPGSSLIVDSLTAGLIQQLGVIDGLNVTHQRSAFMFKDKPLNLPDIGKRLGVNLIVAGDVSSPPVRWSFARRSCRSGAVIARPHCGRTRSRVTSDLRVISPMFSPRLRDDRGRVSAEAWTDPAQILDRPRHLRDVFESSRAPREADDEGG